MIELGLQTLICQQLIVAKHFLIISLFDSWLGG